MSSNWNIAFLFLFLCSLSLSITAQQYSYIQYNTNASAPFDQVSTVMQDAEGFMWIGSQNGLYRFDGIHFEPYSLQTESQFIHQLQRRDEQLLFVNDLGVYQINQLDKQPLVSPLLEGSINESPELPFYPNDVVFGQEQEFWISQSNHSIGRWYQGKFQSYPFSKNNKAQQLSIQNDNNGDTWVLSKLDGLFYFDEEQNRFQSKAKNSKGNCLLITTDYLLIGNEDLYIYRLKNKQIRLLKKVAFEEDLITAIHEDDQGHFIVGTKNGYLFTLEDFNQAPQRIYGGNEAHRVEALDFGQIYEIYSTRDSVNQHSKLWICSATGLWLLQERFFKTVDNLPMNNPIAIAMGKNGKAWVPMNYLYEISPGEEGFTAKTIYNNIQATAVTYDTAGYTWVSSSTPTIQLLKYAGNNLLQRFDFHDRGEAIFNLFADSRENLWFCQAPLNKPIIGIGKISASGEMVNYDETKGFSSRILAIKESSRGELYAAGIGEQSYLYRYDPALDRFENLSPTLPFQAILNFEAHDLTIDDRGIVWLATTDGLLRYDGEKVDLIQNDILGQEEVRGVTHYSNNNIWISTATKGLVFHQQNTSTVLGEPAGLPAVISAYRCITTDEAGRVWAGTAEGLVYSRMSAAQLPLSNTPRIRKIINGQHQVELTDSLIKVRRRHNLEIQFSNLSFPAKNVQYQYRMIPKKDRQILLEEQLWTSVQNNILTVDTKQLGKFLLEVRARQTGGYQWSKALEVELEVFLPWFLQSWFLYSAIGLLIAFVAYYFRFFVKRRISRLQEVLKYSNEKLAKKEAQLHQKIQEFEEQQEELANATSNIQTLELFIKEIPKKASWNDIITAMGKAVDQSADIDAFEIAFVEKNEIVHKGYSNQERSGYTFRSKPFSPKTSLTSWAIANGKEVLINNFDREHTLYIDRKPAYRFNSLLFIPFTLENNQSVALCAYSIGKDQFDQKDLVMFRILSQFIFFSIHQEITKEA